VKTPLKPGKPFQFRNGVGGFYWKGVATKPDLGAQPPDRPRRVVNGRYVGGHIVARPPVYTSVAQIPFQTGPGGLDSYWLPIFVAEHPSYAGLKLWWGAALPISFADTGGAVGFVDTDADPEFQEVALYYQSANYAPHIERFANFIYVGGVGSLRRIYRFDTAPDQQPSTLATVPTDEIVVSYPGFQTQALQLHDGKLYYVLGDPTGTANGYIYSWDGFQSLQEVALTTSADEGAATHSFKNTLVVTVRGQGSINVRAADGTWSTATVASFDSSGYFNSMAELHDKLYIMGGDDKIYSWNGTTLSVARTIIDGTDPEQANCCVSFGGRLYYLWAELLAPTGYGHRYPWVGRFDPDDVDATYKWQDDYKDFGYATGTEPVADGHDTGGDHPYVAYGVPTAMAVYRQRIVAAIGSELVSPSGLYANMVTHSVQMNPYSDWHIAHPNSFLSTPTGPVYFSEGTSTGGDPHRLYSYFKVL
jgi:hypothetical protein